MRRWLLPVILLLAFLLRAIALDRFPAGFTPDEASFGYDALSLLTTGKDQWGKTLPLVLESFGDFKPPFYAYLTVPFVWIFDLTKTSVRLPNALLGTFAVIAVYLMARELFRVGKTKLDGELVALVAAFLLAISPWHVMMSRGAFEANLTTFFLPLGIYLLLKGLKKPTFLIWAAIVLGINLFTYHSARLITPLVIAAFVILFRNEIKKIPSGNISISVVLFLSFFVIAGYTLFQGGATRARDISILNGALNEAAEQRTATILQGTDPTLARLLHNKYQVSARRFINNYTQYTSYRFLFTDGPAEGTYGMIPGRGVLYWFGLPLIIGFFWALFKFKDKRALFFILVWVLIAPIAASLTQGRGYAGNRAVIMIPGIQLLLSVGAVAIWGWLRESFSITFAKLILIFYALAVFVFFASFLEDYFVLSPLKNGKAMLSGNLEIADWLSENAQGGDEVVVSKKLSEPHIYFAFANKWDPTEYQNQTKDWERYRSTDLLFIDQLGEYRLGRYTFRDIHFPVDQTLANTVLVGRPEDFSEEANIIHTEYFDDGKPSVLVVKPSEE